METFGPFLSQSISLLAGILLLSFIAVADQFTKFTRMGKLPIAGRKWKIEPLFITRYRSVLGMRSINREAWDEYKDRAYTVLRPDSNITVLPPRYVDELQNVDNRKLNPMDALSSDMLGALTGMDILTTGHLVFDAVRNKMTPRIGQMLPVFVEELDFVFSTVFPSSTEWTPVDMNQAMTRIISSLTSRTWVGKELARDQDWHRVNMEATANIFATAIPLKLLPAFLQPAVASILPVRRKMRRSIEAVHAYLIPEIEARRQRQLDDPTADKPEDMLQWMMDAAQGEEADPLTLSKRYVYGVIGSLFTVSGALADCAYDLAAYPEHVEPLRDEARRVLKEDGGWQKGTPAKLVLMDSFMKESQRFNAPSPLSFKRVTKEELILSDGLTIPKNTYICVCHPASIGHDEKTFDGFRYARNASGGLSSTGPSTSKSRQTWYTSTDRSHIIFGHGRYACPGRFVAAVEIKLVLATLLLNYNIAFEHKGEIGFGPEKRPKTQYLLELAFGDQAARVYLQKRSEVQ